MNADIQLLEPHEADERWRIKIKGSHGMHTTLPLLTSIPLWETTARVVELLHRMHKHATIRAPDGTTVSPKPTGVWPRLHSSQPSKG